MEKKKTELKIAYENMMRKKKIETHLMNLEKRIRQQTIEINRQSRIVTKEEEDVIQLERLNLHSIFQTILGNKKQELEKERQEYLMAVMQLQGTEKNLETLIYEKEILEKQLSGLFNADLKFDLIYEKISKTFHLLLDEKTKAKLSAIELRILNHEERIKEIREAIQAGKKAEKALLKIITDLSNIKRWGNPYIQKSTTSSTYKRRFTAYEKKKFVKRGRQEVNRTNNLLNHFELEILDIQKQFKLDYRGYTKSFSDFLEIFYDNLITDWIVKQNINNTAHAIETIHDKVIRILAMLNNEITKTKDYILEEKQLKKMIIMNY